MLRVNDYASHTISNDLKDRLVQQFDKVVTVTDLIIFSDFSYGLLDADLVEKIMVRAKRRAWLSRLIARHLLNSAT